MKLKSDINKRMLIEINKYIETNGISPSIRDLKNVTGYSSTSTIKKHLDQLERLGWISKLPNKARSIKVNIKL